MSKNWIGQCVSIKCVDSLGIFQGTIKEANAEKITIVRAFRNGLPVKTIDTEVTIMATDIIKLDLIPAMTTKKVNGTINAKVDHDQNGGISENSYSKSMKEASKPNRSVRQSPLASNDISRQFNNMQLHKPSYNHMIPSAVEVKLGSSAPSGGFPISGSSNSNNNNNSSSSSNDHQHQSHSVSKPIDIIPKNGMAGASANSTTPLKNGRRNKSTGITANDNRINSYCRGKNEVAFGTPVDDPTMDEEFDFEKNLALFDKQAIWDKIDARQPNSARKQTSAKKKNFRHDEMIILCKPTGSRQIKMDFPSGQEFATDTGLIIPAIPLTTRVQIQMQAERMGLSAERQNDMLARGTTDIALILLGGARRLMPQNLHQWPTIVVICDQLAGSRQTEVGLSTVRQLASHGLKVTCYLLAGTNQPSSERRLFNATGSAIATSVKELPSCDLIILSLRESTQQSQVVKWINDSRSPVLAIDPPLAGINGITVKCSILPILPVDGINSATCGKLHLCNLGIPDKVYEDVGIKYKSPFGHKFVIPMHLIDDDFS